MALGLPGRRRRADYARLAAALPPRSTGPGGPLARVPDSVHPPVPLPHDTGTLPSIFNPGVARARRRAALFLPAARFVWRCARVCVCARTLVHARLRLRLCRPQAHARAHTLAVPWGGHLAPHVLSIVYIILVSNHLVTRCMPAFHAANPQIVAPQHGTLAPNGIFCAAKNAVLQRRRR